MRGRVCVTPKQAMELKAGKGLAPCRAPDLMTAKAYVAVLIDFLNSGVRWFLMSATLKSSLSMRRMSAAQPLPLCRRSV